MQICLLDCQSPIKIIYSAKVSANNRMHLALNYCTYIVSASNKGLRPENKEKILS